MSNKIKCPKCGADIPNSAIIVQRIQEQIKEKSRQEFEKEFTEKESVLVKQLQDRLFEEKKKREESQKKELEILKLKSDLEDRAKSLDLELQKKLIEEKRAIEEKATKDAQVLYELKIAEKEKQLEDQKKLIAEMQRKAHQGSMQTQGEVLEMTIEDLLKQNFPTDKIQPVPKGVNGADIIQIVYDQNGQAAGKIAWETKRTKNWTEDWIQKLKYDCQTINADIPILVSEILPKEIQNFGQYKNVWICNFSHILGLATAMRIQIIAVSSAIVAETGKDQKMEAIYKYLTSNTFAHKIQALVETFDNMKQSLDAEKRAISRIWSTREVQIVRLTENTAKMYGEIQGIAGKLPTIKLLELDNVKDDSKKENPTDSQSNLFNS